MILLQVAIGGDAEEHPEPDQPRRPPPSSQRSGVRLALGVRFRTGKQASTRITQSTRLLLSRSVVRALTVAVVLAFAVGCGGEETSDSPRSEESVQVPDLVEMQNRPAQHLLAKAGLRWSYDEGEHAFGEPPPPNRASTADDDYILKQSPEPGEWVEPGSVVNLVTSCSLEPLPEGAVCID